MYPYRAGQNDLASIIPPWAHEGGAEALVSRLRDVSLRPRLEREILGEAPLGDWYNHYTATGSWEGMLLVRLTNPRYQQFAGRRMSDVIATLGEAADRRPLRAARRERRIGVHGLLPSQ